MNDTIIIMLVVLFLGVLIIAIVIPRLGRFSKEYYLEDRIEKLETWKQQVDRYLEKEGHLPDSLYEVYQSSGNIMNPSMLWIALVGNKQEHLMENIDLKEKDKFLEFSDYKLSKSDNDIWEISEKVIYNNISDNRLKINSDDSFFIEKNGKWESFSVQ